MNPKVWASSDNGQIRYVSLTNDRVSEVLDVMRKSYYVYENIARALELHKCPEALEELDKIPLKIMQHGISIVAIDENTSKVVGFSLNELNESPSPNEVTYLEKLKNGYKNELAKNYIDFLIQTDKNHNLFTQFNVDCYMEICFVSVLPNYKNMGIAKKLSEVSIEMAWKLLAGENIKQSLTSETLTLEPVPKGIVGIVTSPISEKVCIISGFKEVAVSNFSTSNFLTKNVQELVGDKIFRVKIFWLKSKLQNT